MWPDSPVLAVALRKDVVMCLCSTQTVNLPPGVAFFSLYAEGSREAEIHKYLESQKAGRDLGDAAILDWSQKYWHKFLRAHWIDHFFGRKYLVELEAADFGLLKEAFQGSEVLPRILQMLYAAAENLDIIVWFHRQNLPVDEMLDILEQLDINSKRLQFSLEQRLSHSEAENCPCRLAG